MKIPRRPVALVLLLLLPLQGCSLLFVQGPPADHRQRTFFACTKSEAGPVLDILWGLELVGVTAILITLGDALDEAPGLALFYGGWGIASFFVAGSGMKKTSACRDAKQQLALRQTLNRQADTATRPSQPVQEVGILPSDGTLSVGERLQLVATAHASSGAGLPLASFAWSSSNDAIASVSNAGLVTAHAAGSVVIAASANNVVGTTNIVVTPR